MQCTDTWTAHSEKRIMMTNSDLRKCQPHPVKVCCTLLLCWSSIWLRFCELEYECGVEYTGTPVNQMTKYCDCGRRLCKEDCRLRNWTLLQKSVLRLTLQLHGLRNKQHNCFFFLYLLLDNSERFDQFLSIVLYCLLLNISLSFICRVPSERFTSF